jgi:hypothetical protein
MQQMQRTLSLDDIHSQWYLDRSEILPSLPVAQFAKARNPIILQPQMDVNQSHAYIYTQIFLNQMTMGSAKRSRTEYQ